MLRVKYGWGSVLKLSTASVVTCICDYCQYRRYEMEGLQYVKHFKYLYDHFSFLWTY
jgi:hypothetical protein